MGIIKDYKQIENKKVVIIGVGGVGAIVSEMMVRLGIGEIMIYDYDEVEYANMNRIFYVPS